MFIDYNLKTELSWSLYSMFELKTFHVIITFNIEPKKFNDLYVSVKDFLENEVSKDEGFISAKFHTNKEQNILINYASWKSQKHYERYKAKTGTVTERAKKVLSYEPIGNEVWHIGDL